MKKIIIIFAIVFPFLFSACSTMGGGKASEEMLSITKSVEVANTSKDQLYVKANEWAVSVFNHADSVIEYSDKEAGKFSGKYSSHIPFALAQDMNVTSIITIDVKDNKARIIINKPYYSYDLWVGNQKSHEEGLVTDLNTITSVREKWIPLIDSFEKAISTPVETDW
jgi:hypothetical protein